MHFKIIIPMYNVEKWVQTTIKSVLAQTHSDYEVIIVDDISTDNSCQKVKELIEKQTGMGFFPDPCGEFLEQVE